MSNITFCWELGRGYGHLAGFKPLAQVLLNYNHKITALLRDVSNAHKFLDGIPVSYFPAPKWQATRKYTAPTINYADIISRCGYDSKESLLPLVQQWRSRFLDCNTELLIVDHSPTALLAARTLNLPATLFGTGFFSPPLEYPMPSLTPWLDAQPFFLKDIEDNVLGVINGVLCQLDAPKLDYLYQLFEVDENFLCTFPELDPYDNRSPDAFWGPRFDITNGVAAHWPENRKKNIFIYTMHSYVFLQRFLMSLGDVDANFLVHCVGMGEEAANQYTQKNIRFSLEPVQLQSIANRADLVICHAGHGTVAASLLMGIPLLLLPTHLEQVLMANKLSALKLSGVVNMRDEQPDFVQSIEFVLNSAECRRRVGMFASHYAGFDPKKQLEDITLACEKILLR